MKLSRTLKTWNLCCYMLFRQQIDFFLIRSQFFGWKFKQILTVHLCVNILCVDVGVLTPAVGEDDAIPNESVHLCMQQILEKARDLHCSWLENFRYVIMGEEAR